MAHFAQLNKHSVVEQVVVVHNNELLDENGVEQEQLGVAFLKSLYGNATVWVQTSYNNNFRRTFAGRGFTYNKRYDIFIDPAPSEQHEFNYENQEWELPEGDA
jgi:hypothetical protein